MFRKDDVSIPKAVPIPDIPHDSQTTFEVGIDLRRKVYKTGRQATRSDGVKGEVGYKQFSGSKKVFSLIYILCSNCSENHKNVFLRVHCMLFDR